MSQKDIEENYGLITANRTMLNALIREVVSGSGAAERADRLEAALQGAIDNVNDASPNGPKYRDGLQAFLHEVRYRRQDLTGSK